MSDKFGEYKVKCLCGNEIDYNDIKKKASDSDKMLTSKLYFVLIGFWFIFGMISVVTYKMNDILFGFSLACSIGFLLLFILSDITDTVGRRTNFVNENNFELVSKRNNK